MELKSAGASDSVLVFCCHISKFRGLKMQIYYLTISVGQKSSYRLAGSSVQGLTKWKSRC